MTHITQTGVITEEEEDTGEHRIDTGQEAVFHNQDVTTGDLT